MARRVAAMLAGEIEQRLKQMKVAPVDQGHRYGYVF
jgi:hypothetical protein